MKTLLPPVLKMAKPCFAAITTLLTFILVFVSCMNPVNAQSILITGISGTPVCAGSQVTINFSVTNGSGSAKYTNTSAYRIYLSNSTGTAFTLAASFSLSASYNTSNGGTTSNLSKTFTIPANTVAGTGYKISMGSVSPSYNGSPFTLNASSAFTINNRPTAVLSGSNTICSGSNTNLNLSVTGTGTISGTLSNGVSFSGTAPTISVQVAPTATTTYTIATLSSPTCAATAADLSGSATITVNQRPTAVISGDGVICSGGNTNLTLAVTGTGTLNGTLSDGTAFSGSAPSITINVSPLINTNYLVATLGNGTCTATAADLSGIANVTVTQPVAINSQPIAAQTVCSGTNASISVSASGTGSLNYQWYKGSTQINNGGRFSGANSNTLSINPVVVTDAYSDYHVMISDAGGCAAVTSGNSSLTINQEIFISTQPPATLTTCEGSPISLQVIASGTGPFTAQWYNGAQPVNTGISDISDATTITTTLNIDAATIADAGSYYVVVNSAAGSCSSEFSSQSAVQVNAISADPVAASGSPIVICNGQYSTLTLNGGGGGNEETIRWYTSSCGGTLAGTGNNLQVNPTVTTTYYGRYENGAPCNYNSGCAEITITLNSSPADPVSATATSNIICAGQNTLLSLNGGGGAPGEIVHWYTSGCNTTPVGTGNNFSVSPTVTTTYYGRYESSSPCTYVSACKQVTVTVNQKSTNPASVIASPASICSGGSSSLTLTGGIAGTGSVIRWYTASCGGTLVGSGNGFTVSPVITTTYYGRYEDPAPCNNNSSCVQATVTVIQPASANAGTPISICGDATQATPTGATAINVTAGATASNYSSVLWTSSGTGTFTNATSLTLASYTPSAADKTAGTVTLTLKAFGNSPCGNAMSTKVLTIGKTIVNVVKLTSVCATGNEAMVLIDQGSPAISGGNGTYSYQWYFSTPGNSNFQPIPGANNANIVISQANNNGFYRRMVTSGGCVAYSNSIHVNANNAILATSFIVTGGGAYCGSGQVGVPVGLSGSVDGAPVFTVTYQLFRDNIYTGLSLNGTGSAINFPNQLIPGVYTIKAALSVIGGNSCDALPINGNVVVAVDAPVPAAVSGNNQALCNTFNTTISGNDPAPYTGTWTLISGSGTISSPGTASTSVAGLSLGDNVFQWKISNNTCADSSRLTIHVDPALSIINQPLETVFCAGENVSISVTTTGNNVQYQWMQSTDNGTTYTNIQNNSTFSGANTNTLQLNATPVSLSGSLYKVQVSVNAPCNTSIQSNTIALLSKNLWMGNTNSDWFTASNWSGGILPGNSCPDVRIAVSNNQPVLGNGTAALRNIIIDNGASLTIDNATMKVSGSIFNSGNLIASNGTVEFNGLSGQSIAANTFQGNALLNLTIGTNDTLSLNGALDVYGKLSFTGTGKTFLTNDHLTLKSTASGTAFVGEIPEDDAGNALDFIKGNVTVERFIPAQKAWRLLSIPTNTTQSIHQSWQENQPANSTSLSGFGIQITGEYVDWDIRGFDIRTPTGPSMKFFNPSINNFQGIASTHNGIKTNQGYMVIIRGDRTVNAYNQAPTPTVLRTSGALYTGKQNAIAVDTDQFTAVGNPFASAIDFSRISRTGGVQDVFYVWDPKLAVGYGLGGYQTFFHLESGYIAVPGGGSYASGNTAIESGQAFLVHASGAPGTVTIAENAKTAGSNLVTRDAAAVKQLRVNLSVISANNTILLDGAISLFDPAFGNGYDNMDITKIFNQAENMGITGNGKNYIAEMRAIPATADTIFYNLSGLKQREYKLEILTQNLSEPGLVAFLEDSYLQTSTLVSLNGTTLQTFIVNSDPLSQSNNRFRIVFKQLHVLPVSFTKIMAKRNTDNSVMVNWNVEEEINMEKYEVERSQDGHTFSKVGTISNVQNNAGNKIYELNDMNAGTSDLYYRIKGLNAGGQAQYSSVAKVSSINLNSSISIYPNPVVNNTINIRFRNQVAGQYAVKLVSTQGQVVFNAILTIKSEHQDHQVKKMNLSPGIYLLDIISPDGNRFTQQVFVK